MYIWSNGLAITINGCQETLLTVNLQWLTKKYNQRCTRTTTLCHLAIDSLKTSKTIQLVAFTRQSVPSRYKTFLFINSSIRGKNYRQTIVGVFYYFMLLQYHEILCYIDLWIEGVFIEGGGFLLMRSLTPLFPTNHHRCGINNNNISLGLGSPSNVLKYTLSFS